MAQVRQQQQQQQPIPSQLPQQIPTLPDVRFQSSPSKNIPGAYNPQVNGQNPYPGPPARAMYPQQTSNYPPTQMGNRPPPPPQISNHPSAQMGYRPPPPQPVNYPPPQISNHPSAQMGNRPPPPRSNHPSAQMGNRPPPPPQMVNYPPPQRSNHPSAQIGNRPPLQVVNYPPSQIGNYPPPQMVNRPPPQISNHSSAQMGNRLPPQMGNRPPSHLTHVLGQTGVIDGSHNPKHDPFTGAILNTPAYNNHGNPEHSYNINPLNNQLASGERQIPPVTSAPLSDSLYPFQRDRDLSMIKYNEREESSGIRTVSDDDALSVVSMNKKHLPVFARFPFDINFLSQPMDTNLEDSIHDLRHRIIESELNHQRRSSDEYIKRTHRIGTETDPEIQLDLERELEIQKIQASLNTGRRSRQPPMISNYSYEPRFHMNSLSDIIEERHYTTSNMDDLIDSMARRHLADRRYDASAERRRSGLGGYSPYFESSPIGRRVPLRSQQRNDDIYYSNTTPTSYIEHDLPRTSPNGLNPMFRSGVDHHHHHRNPSDVDGMSSSNLLHSGSSPKLPPISLGNDTNRSNRSQQGLTSTLYQTKHNLHGYRNYQQSIPLGLPDHTEHLIELPSDIFLTTRKPLSSARRHRSIRKTKPKTVRRHKSNISEDSETDPSDNENQLFNNKHRRHRSKHREDQRGFFTERDPQPKHRKKTNHRRQLFRKAIIAVLFINVLKHRATKNRSKSSRQSLSATIHKIRLQEIMVALHRVYLEPEGPIYNALIQATMSSVELKNALNTSSKHYSEAIFVIGDALKNIISKIVDFMPKDGILGTSKNSAISALIQPGNPFPENYFWQCEKELLEFDKTRLINITKQRAILLLIGSFIFRALVTTLLTKPIKYRLLLGQLTPNQSASLKVLASVIFYVGRRVVKSAPQILTLPHEWSLSLYSDADIKPIIQHSEIKPIITSCEQSLRSWCEQYIRRIDASFGKELRE